jgi:hypothetical protein
MSEIILELILEFRYLIGISIAVGLLILIISFVLADNLEWNSKQMRFLGLFYKQSFHETMWFSSSLLRIVFILSSVIFGLKLGISYIVFYLLSSTICCLAALDIKRFFLELINGAVLYGALLSLGILIGYYKEIYSDTYVLVIYILLGIFTILYATYFYLRGIAGIMRNKIERFNRNRSEAE